MGELTVRLFPVDSGAGIGGRRREYDLAPDAVPVGGGRRRRGRRCRCVVVDRPEDRVDERVQRQSMPERSRVPGCVPGLVVRARARATRDRIGQLEAEPH